MVKADSTMRVGERMQVAREDTCVRCGPGYALPARMIADQHMAANGFACQRVRSAHPLPVGASRILDGVGRGFWMPKFGVVESRICGAGVGFWCVGWDEFSTVIRATVVGHRERSSGI